MEAFTQEGLSNPHVIGSGSGGVMYRAEDAKGNLVAVKVFQSLAVNKPLLARQTQRLEQGGWAKGVMPVISASFDTQPAMWVVPYLVDDNHKPSSLQHRLIDYPADNSWEIVREIALALSEMHKRNVVHGNLKPGNVFFSHNGEVYLADWAMGHMPSGSALEFTDAYLYQAPEQLRFPNGLLSDEGYRWDVFSFGVLAYRLLTGNFPRCHDTFISAAPLPGESRREGIVADVFKIAQSIEAMPNITWSDEAKNAREQQYRDLIRQCLSLKAYERPASMVEVNQSFIAIDDKSDAEEKCEELLDQRRHAEKKMWFWRYGAAALLGIVTVLTMLWQMNSHWLAKEKRERKEEFGELRETTRLAVEGKAAAEGKAKQEISAALTEKKHAEDTLRLERGIWLARIDSIISMNDQLFSWSLEKGNRALPPLDGRINRLKRLETTLQDFLTKNKDIPELTEERARAKMELAEISLSLGDDQVASTRFDEALKASVDITNKNADWLTRVATARLMLGLIQQSHNDKICSSTFSLARTNLDEAKAAGAETDRIKQMRAILDYHEARQLLETGNEAKALELLTQATQALNELVMARPDMMVLRSELASCFLSSATILDGMDRAGDAREVRGLAVTELLTLLKNKPNDFKLRSDLSGIYGSMAEAAVLSGDIEAAKSLSKSAVDLLEKLIREQPENAQVASRLAAQRGLMAGIIEDSGDSKTANVLLDEGIHYLESHVMGEKSDALASYRLAMLQWQKGRLTGNNSDRKAELALYQKSIALFQSLEKSDSPSLQPEQIKRSLGYLLGDAGHAAQLTKNAALAKEYFTQSVAIWQYLLTLQPKNEEYEDSLAWSRTRLNDVK